MTIETGLVLLFVFSPDSNWPDLPFVLPISDCSCLHLNEQLMSFLWLTQLPLLYPSLHHTWRAYDLQMLEFTLTIWTYTEIPHFLTKWQLIPKTSFFFFIYYNYSCYSQLMGSCFEIFLSWFLLAVIKQQLFQAQIKSYTTLTICIFVSNNLSLALHKARVVE